MELLKQSTGQARDVFVSMPPLSRVIFIAMMILVIGGLAMFIRSSSTPNHELLFGGRTLVDHELDAIELAFSRSGLNAWSREGRQIQIPRDKRSEYLSALSEASALPFTLRNPMQEALESNNLFDSNSARDSREMLAKEQDLGMKITAFPDIQWASVEYDQGEKRGLSATRPQSASVLVMPEGSQPLHPNRIKSIEDLVRGSFAGLESEDIVVIDTNAEASGAVENEDPLFRKQKEAEASIEQKLRGLLAGFPAKIAVSAEIDPTMDAHRAVLKIQSEPVHLVTPKKLIDVMQNQESLIGSSSEIASVIGNRSVIVEETVNAPANPEDGTIQGQQYEASRLASLQIKSVRVSVGLPTSYYEQLFDQESSKINPMVIREKRPAMSEEDFERLRAKTKKVIQTAVTVLLPSVTKQDDTPLVEVWDYADFPNDEIFAIKNSDGFLAWLSGSWVTLLVVSICVFGLWNVLGGFRAYRTKVHLPNSDVMLSRTGELSQQEQPQPNLHSMLDAEGDPPEVERALSTSVESDPEAATKVIRSWIRQAA